MDFSHLQVAGAPGLLLEKELQVFTKQVPRGVTKGFQRLENVCANFENLSVEAAYQLLNPPDFEREVEEARLKNLNRLFIGPIFWRTFFSIAPLIATWAALFDAASNYLKDPRATHIPTGATSPSSFFILWQDGFGGRALHFSYVAAIDVTLLFCFLFFTLLVQLREDQAQKAAVRFSQDFQGITTKLISFIALQGAVQVAQGADVKTVADAVNRAIQRALDASKQVTDQAQKAVADMQQQMQTVITSMSAKIDTVQQQMQGMTTAGTQLGSSVGTLATSANALAANSSQYMQAGQLVQQQIDKLNVNEQALVQRLDAVSGSVSGAAQMMGLAVKSSTDLADRIRQDMGTGVQQMTGNINQSAQVLTSTQRSLQGTTTQLDQVTQDLAHAAKIMQDTALQFEQVLRATGYIAQPQQVQTPRNVLDWIISRNRKKRPPKGGKP